MVEWTGKSINKIKIKSRLADIGNEDKLQDQMVVDGDEENQTGQCSSPDSDWK